MAGVFGKDPNMNKAGGHKELDRVMGERIRKKGGIGSQVSSKEADSEQQKDGAIAEEVSPATPKPQPRGWSSA